jgi:hypothetical protein
MHSAFALRTALMTTNSPLIAVALVLLSLTPFSHLDGAEKSAIGSAKPKPGTPAKGDGNGWIYPYLVTQTGASCDTRWQRKRKGTSIWAPLFKPYTPVNTAVRLGTDTYSVRFFAKGDCKPPMQLDNVEVRVDVRSNIEIRYVNDDKAIKPLRGRAARTRP